MTNRLDKPFEWILRVVLATALVIALVPLNSFACNDWPLCLGFLVPYMDMAIWWSWVYRLSLFIATATAGFFILKGKKSQGRRFFFVIILTSLLFWWDRRPIENHMITLLGLWVSWIMVWGRNLFGSLKRAAFLGIPVFSVMFLSVSQTEASRLLMACQTKSFCPPLEQAVRSVHLAEVISVSSMLTGWAWGSFFQVKGWLSHDFKAATLLSGVLALQFVFGRLSFSLFEPWLLGVGQITAILGVPIYMIRATHPSRMCYEKNYVKS